MNASSRLYRLLPALLLLGFVAAAPALAQERPGRQLDPEQMAERRLQHLDASLDLTDAQEAQIREILVESTREMYAAREAARAERQGTREGFAARFRAETQATVSAIEAVLTPEQQKSYAEMREQLSGRMEQRRDRVERPRGGKFRGARLDGARRSAAGLTRRLNLTDAQQQQIDTILSSRREEARAWNQAHPDATREERLSFFTEHARGTDAAVEAVLTPEQVEQYRALKSQRQERGGPRGNRSGGHR